MFKQILAFLMLAVVVQSQNNNINNNSSLRTDDYINLNRRQNAANINKYDSQMDDFKQNYAAQINTIYIQLDMLTDAQIQNDEHLNPLELLSDKTKSCVAEHRPIIPTIDSVKSAINTCATTASNQVSTLLYSALTTRNTLQSYYSNTYEKQLTNCNQTYQGIKYADCVESATANCNSYTINNQKTFATQMDAAGCSANAQVKKAIECSFATQNSTISLMAEANTLINICLQGLECNRCNQLYSCPNVFYVSKSQVNYDNFTMINPFFGRNETDCLMLDIIE